MLGDGGGHSRWHLSCQHVAKKRETRRTRGGVCTEPFPVDPALPRDRAEVFASVVPKLRRSQGRKEDGKEEKVLPRRGITREATSVEAVRDGEWRHPS